MRNYYKEGRALLEKEEFEKARVIFSEGVENGDKKCIYGLVAVAVTALDDHTKEMEALAKAAQELLLLANRGDADACFMMGRCFEMGVGLPTDIDRALEYYHKAASLGNTDAMFNLGCFFLHTSMDEQEVFTRYYLPSAVRGNKNACLAVACRYESLGLMSDAEYWYSRAAESGAPSAIKAKDDFIKRKSKA